MQQYFFIPCKFRPNYNLCFELCILPHLHIWTEVQLVQYNLVVVLAVARTCIYRVDFPSLSACWAPTRRNQPAGGFTTNCSTSIIRIPASNYCTIHFSLARIHLSGVEALFPAWAPSLASLGRGALHQAFGCSFRHTCIFHKLRKSLKIHSDYMNLRILTKCLWEKGSAITTCVCKGFATVSGRRIKSTRSWQDTALPNTDP